MVRIYDDTMNLGRNETRYADNCMGYAFKQHNGSRTEAAKRYTGDCGPIAMAITTGRPYDECTASLRDELCLDKNRGTYFRQWLHSLEWRGKSFHGFTFKEITFPAVAGEKRMTPETFTQRYPEGRYIVKMRRHLIACVDGVFMGEWPPERAIYAAWKVEKTS